MIRIRKGTPGDIEAIMTCYDAARRFMRASGNHSQWINGYPSRVTVENDIANGVNYVGEDEAGILVMVFAFILGEDPTYAIIEGGEWLNTLPYGTIHRLGSTGRRGGVLKACIDFCFTKTDNIRLDTHADNIPMQKGAGRLGFIRCGIIYCADNTPRLAYQKHLFTPHISTKEK